MEQQKQAVQEPIFDKNRSPGKTFSLGLRHVLAMYAGAIIVPLIVGGALGLTTGD